MIGRMIPRSIGLVLTFWLVQPALAQQGAPERTSLSLRCEMICNPAKLRTGVAIISWQDSRLKATSLSQAHIDVTVFKDGFDKNVFVSFLGAKPGQKTTMSEETSKGMPSGLRLRALDLIFLSAIQPELKGDQVVQRAASQLENGETGALVENVEPGVNYFWRLRFSAEGKSRVSETTQCEAPVCPADMVEEKR
jgi:hypothetical protein